MRRYIAILLLSLSLAAHASSTYRVGSEVLTVGDSAVRAMPKIRDSADTCPAA